MPASNGPRREPCRNQEQSSAGIFAHGSACRADDPDKTFIDSNAGPLYYRVVPGEIKYQVCLTTRSADYARRAEANSRQLRWKSHVKLSFHKS